jgi:hypothetical protein
MEFNKCTLIYLENELGLQPVRQHTALQAWVAMPQEITDFERRELTELRDQLDFNVLHWNEQELAMQFIGPMLSLVRFTSYQFNLFAGRSLSGTVKGVDFFGKPDGMIASGYREPKVPYFCFQEYKRDLDNSGDPAGQCLAAMLVGQTLNPHAHIMYGAYVVGRDWYFLVLDKNEYAISRDYSAVTDDIFDIFRILKALKQMITLLVSEDNG